MAAALFKQHISGLPDEQEWQIGSAGTWGLDGQPAVAPVIELMSHRGIDIGNHRARSVTGSLMASADLILAMEKGQVEGMKVEFPEARERIFLISEMIGGLYEIRDPYGGGKVTFEETLQELEVIFNQGLARIIELASKNADRE
jgi:protein-tyrosine phosphatase